MDKNYIAGGGVYIFKTMQIKLTGFVLLGQGSQGWARGNII